MLQARPLVDIPRNGQSFVTLTRSFLGADSDIFGPETLRFQSCHIYSLFRRVYALKQIA